jgi:hypothetical protein
MRIDAAVAKHSLTATVRICGRHENDQQARQRGKQ